MIYHIGIDAGFFTEYTYMLHAMLYCLQHKIQFKLYSDDANFGWEKGWEELFSPPSASKCTNRFITLITPIASPPGRH